MIRSITPTNFPSFGPDNLGLDPQPLNILIGPNGCGKSNLIEAQASCTATKELRDVTRKGGEPLNGSGRGVLANLLPGVDIGIR